MGTSILYRGKFFQSNFETQVAARSVESAAQLELALARGPLAAGEPVLRLAALRLTRHLLVLQDLLRQRRAFGRGRALARRGDPGRRRRDTGVERRRRGQALRFGPALLGQFDLLLERQAVRDAGDALDQGLALAAMATRPEQAATVGLAQIERGAAGAGLQPEQQTQCHGLAEPGAQRDGNSEKSRHGG